MPFCPPLVSIFALNFTIIAVITALGNFSISNSGSPYNYKGYKIQCKMRIACNYTFVDVNLYATTLPEMCLTLFAHFLIFIVSQFTVVPRYLESRSKLITIRGRFKIASPVPHKFSWGTPSRGDISMQIPLESSLDKWRVFSFYNSGKAAITPP